MDMNISSQSKSCWVLITIVFGGIERRVRRAAIAVGFWAKGQLEC